MANDADWSKLPYTRPEGVGRPGERKCAAFKRDGTRCENWALVGGTNCMVHSAPLARVAAKKRLMTLVEPAMMVAYEIMMDELNEPDTRLKAALAILDRAGLGPNATLHMKDERESHYEKMDRLALADRALALAEEFKRRALTSGAIEAQVVKSENEEEHEKSDDGRVM